MTKQHNKSVPPPELSGDNADDYEIIDYRETYCLVQQSSSHVILVYRSPVIRNTLEHTLKTTPVPDNVLEGCYADVSLLAGLMVGTIIYRRCRRRDSHRDCQTE